MRTVAILFVTFWGPWLPDEKIKISLSWVRNSPVLDGVFFACLLPLFLQFLSVGRGGEKEREKNTRALDDIVDRNRAYTNIEIHDATLYKDDYDFFRLPTFRETERERERENSRLIPRQLGRITQFRDPLIEHESWPTDQRTTGLLPRQSSKDPR